MVTLLTGTAAGAAVFLSVYLLVLSISSRGGSTFFFMNFHPALLACVVAIIGAIMGLIVGALAFTRILWLVRIAGVLLFNFNSIHIINESIIRGDSHRLEAAAWVLGILAGSIACAELVIRTRRPLPKAVAASGTQGA